MNPIFKNFSDSTSQLLTRIQEETSGPVFTYINPEAKNYCSLISSDLIDINNYSSIAPTTLVILDDGSTRVSEYIEYTDRIRNLFPTTKIIIAVPVIPESEKTQFESICDTLMYLHSEPLFFEINQFYQSST